jgi:hypothetical protein
VLHIISPGQWQCELGRLIISADYAIYIDGTHGLMLLTFMAPGTAIIEQIVKYAHTTVTTRACDRRFATFVKYDNFTA